MVSTVKWCHDLSY